MSLCRSVILKSSRRAAAAAVIACAFAASARAAPATDYPASPAEPDVLKWLADRTSVTQGSVLVIQRLAAISLERRTAADKGGVVHAGVREEIIDADTASRALARSVLLSVDLDCSQRRFRILSRTLYGQPDLKGEGRTEAGSQAWTPVDPGAPIGKAWQAVCSKDFAFPYAVRTEAKAPAPPESRSEPKPPTPAAAPAQAQAKAQPPPQLRAEEKPSEPARVQAKTAPQAETRSVAKAEPPSTPAKPPKTQPKASAPAAAPASAKGDYEVVLGSYTVQTNAQGAADRLEHGYGDALAGRRAAIRSISANGKAYSVVSVAAFASVAEANDFCGHIKKSALPCTVKRIGRGKS